VAGIIGGKQSGVAKQVYLRGVRVLDCAGKGTTATVIAGLEYVLSHSPRPAVANLSLETGYSPALDAAATQLDASGVPVIVAAGNGSVNACIGSPAGADGVLVVSAVDGDDVVEPYSNYGDCVDIFAPGHGIRSTWNNAGYKTMSGTSMAAPFVTGYVARILSIGGFTPTAAKDLTLNLATPNVIHGDLKGSPNALLYTGFM
jgi:subtilisin family serine protease